MTQTNTRQRYAALDDRDLVHEYDWVARDRPVSQHEADRQGFQLEAIEAELRRRGINWEHPHYWH